MTLLTLIFSSWEEMKEANRWCLSDVGADYLISLSNWPESCCYCFASTELTYLNLILVYKSIWGFVFIFVSWECSSKCKRLIHISIAWTSLTTDKIIHSLIRAIIYYLYAFLAQLLFGILNMTCVCNKKQSNITLAALLWKSNTTLSSKKDEVPSHW